jgi:gamma-glutamylcyclotransferase (GGCT)/AIG2-like uncharacterized protein YtfP
MKKQEIMSMVGNMQQLAYIRPVEYRDGRSSKMQAWQVKNEDMSFLVLGDKCLDIGELSYKGQMMSFLSKPGLMGRNHFDTNGQEALRSIMGGFLFTSGLENIGAPCAFENVNYPMHGRIRTTPAEYCSATAVWVEDEYVLTVSGEMREAELFGENMTLRRTIETRFGKKKFIIRDEIENQSFRSEPMMLLYHFNFGYPFLTPQSKIVIPSIKVSPRDLHSEGHIEKWAEMEEPKPNEREYVFMHKLKTDKDGNTYAAVINVEKKLGLLLEFNQKYLPYFMEWKSIASGDYVIGLEPSNSSVYGRLHHVAEHSLHMLEPFEKERIEICIVILDGEKEINEFLAQSKENKIF